MFISSHYRICQQGTAQARSRGGAYDTNALSDGSHAVGQANISLRGAGAAQERRRRSATEGLLLSPVIRNTILPKLLAHLRQLHQLIRLSLIIICHAQIHRSGGLDAGAALAQRGRHELAGVAVGAGKEVSDVPRTAQEQRRRYARAGGALLEEVAQGHVAIEANGLLGLGHLGDALDAAAAALARRGRDALSRGSLWRRGCGTPARSHRVDMLEIVRML